MLLKNMIEKKNISREDIATLINLEFGFSKKECLEIVNDIFDIIVEGLKKDKIVKIHNFGTFKLKTKTSRIGRNPKTKEEFLISDRSVVTFKVSKHFLQLLNSIKRDEKIL
tara:strand:+ start:91 stop:423 length:333 start_codon:yes stop_codon:yes gene_type:complete